jgi:hypothetical protein
MLKGINKQILEVTNTDSPYFEKIIFFVRPQSQHMNEEQLQKEAEKISTQMKKPPKTKRTAKQILSTAFYTSLGLGAGVAITFILNNFIR